VSAGPGSALRAALLCSCPGTRTKVFTETERAALALTEQGTRLADSAGVDDETWEAARKHFDDEELAALTALIGVINAFNRFNVILRTPAGDYQPGRSGKA
jgi:alkylhydroperoxidase family enzyme